MFNKRVVFSVMFFTLCMSVIIVVKPSALFDHHGKIKEFGVGSDKTIYPMGVVVVLLSTITFYFFSLVDMLYR